MTLERRELLRLSGATAVASTVGIAGCLDGSDSTGDEPGESDGDGGEGEQSAPYRDWAVTDTDGELVVAAIDWAALEALESIETELDVDDYGSSDGENPLDDEADLMLAAPLMGSFLVAFGAFGTLGTGLEGLLGSGDDLDWTDDETDDDADDEGGPGGDAFETTVEDVFWVNEAYVMAGDVETDEIHEALTAEPDAEFSLKTVYERTTAIGDFDVYEPAERAEYDATQDAVAVGEDAVVISMGTAGDPIEQLRGPIEAYGGEAPRAVDRHDDLDWLVETAGDGHLAFGVYGDLDGDDIPVDGADDEYGDLVGSTAFAGSWRIDGPSESTAAFAALFDDLDAETEAQLEARLGSTAADASVAFDGDRVTATGTWNERTLVGTNATDD